MTLPRYARGNGLRPRENAPLVKTAAFPTATKSPDCHDLPRYARGNGLRPRGNAPLVKTAAFPTATTSPDPPDCHEAREGRCHDFPDCHDLPRYARGNGLRPRGNAPLVKTAAFPTATKSPDPPDCHEAREGRCHDFPDCHDLPRYARGNGLRPRENAPLVKTAAFPTATKSPDCHDCHDFLDCHDPPTATIFHATLEATAFGLEETLRS
ncbi:hypothetical protein L21SP4_01847 [Kiritimatiella glycovorans]|uniref:Uncharacterized protein n=1 Tax=Kiritimatiella glycovorans TaxID=1307763 RepID=A0A0G3ELP5_9BACT|nr:hypothetical protein L21SP4_01847 [Kiritimatiella glycovorans]